MSVPKKNQVIGLDIGSHSIKVVEIDHDKRGRVLKNFGMIGLPPGAIVEGSIKEIEIVSSAIVNLFKNLKIKKKAVAASISGYSVIVKKITMDAKDESEIESRIQEEAEQYIPFDINEVNLDFDLLVPTIETEEEGEIREEGSGQMDLMLVAAKKDVVEDYVSLIELSGLNAGVLDVDAFALQNVFEISTQEAEPEGCYAIVNVGAEELSINAVRNGISLFTRDSSYGGSQITEAIKSEFKVSFEEAEKIKLGGVRPDDTTALEEIFSTVVSDWIQEIKRALDFVGNTYPNEVIEQILLCGGSCRIPGFQKYLKLETDIEVAELNPFGNLIVDERVFDPNYLKYVAPQAAVAAGLALRSLGDK